ncbi:MAG: poly-gamma-glutamate hydrolase family protein [Firmicutes bacterium]|nr:poly-gamma-glutamate hydrolase family protein [Bacillota bacterium]
MRILKAGFIVVTISLLLLSVNNITVKAADLYSSFQELSSAKIEGTDYRISSRKTSSSLAIIAIHGGSIEPGTTELADNIAGSSYAYYSFQGIMSSNNSSLHITSTKFDEPIALSLVQSKSRTLSIHGFSSSSKLTYVGGLDKTMIANIKKSLQNAGFNVATAPSNLGGMSTLNIANKNTSKAGVQIELSTAQRASFFSSLTTSGRKTKTAEFYKYTKAIKEALNPTTIVQPKPVEKTTTTTTTTPTVQPKPVEKTTSSPTVQTKTVENTSSIPAEQDTENTDKVVGSAAIVQSKTIENISSDLSEDTSVANVDTTNSSTVQESDNTMLLKFVNAFYIGFMIIGWSPSLLQMNRVG